MPDTNKSIASILDDLYEKLTGVEDPTDDKYTIAQKLKQITSLFTEEELPEKATISGYLDIFKNAFNGGGGGNPDEAIESFLKGEVEELTLQSEVLTPGMISLHGGLRHIYAPNATEVQALVFRSALPSDGSDDFLNIYLYAGYNMYEVDWDHPTIWNQGDRYFEYAEYAELSEYVETNHIFANCSIDIPNVTNIEDSAFRDNRFLEYINTGYDLIRIGYDAFNHCQVLKQLPTWSPQLMIIENSAFSDCVNMHGSVYIPDTITYLGDMAFYNAGIDEINIGGLPFIPDELCNQCYNLKKITIREGVQFIKQSAFNMTYLSNEIHFPETLKTLEEHSFDSCYCPIVAIPKTYHIDTSGGSENCISHPLSIGNYAFYLDSLFEPTRKTSLLEKLVPDIDDRHVEPGGNLDIQLCIDLSEYDANAGQDFQPPIILYLSALEGYSNTLTGWTGYMTDTTRDITYRVRYVFLFNDQDTLDAFKQLTNWASYDVDRFMLKSDYAGPLGDQPGYFNNNSEEVISEEAK